MEKRGGALLDDDRDALITRMRLYCDSSVNWRDFANYGTGLETERNRFDPHHARQLAMEEGFSGKNIRRYAFKPFDNRWCYYSSTRPIWNDPRTRLEEWQRAGNEFLVARAEGIGGIDGTPVFYSRNLGDCDLLRGYAYFFPVRIGGRHGSGPRSNLSKKMTNYLTHLGYADAVTNREVARMVWLHALAITYSTAYLADNAAGVQDGYPRVPFPNFAQIADISNEAARLLLSTSMKIGEQVALLLQPDEYIDGVDSGGKKRTELLGLAELTYVGKEKSRQFTNDSLLLRGWGHINSRNAVVLEYGTARQRRYKDHERADIEDGALRLGLHVGAAYGSLGQETFDVYLNEDWCWRNVPAAVWNYTIGGYPVLRKWLSYRDTSVTNQLLSQEELEYFTKMVRRLAALRLLEPSLNRNYAKIRDCSHCFEKLQK